MKTAILSTVLMLVSTPLPMQAAEQTSPAVVTVPSEMNASCWCA